MHGLWTKQHLGNRYRYRHRHHQNMVNDVSFGAHDKPKKLKICRLLHFVLNVERGEMRLSLMPTQNNMCVWLLIPLACKVCSKIWWWLDVILWMKGKTVKQNKRYYRAFLVSHSAGYKVCKQKQLHRKRIANILPNVSEQIAAILY